MADLEDHEWIEFEQMHFEELKEEWHGNSDGILL
jgi:hypothetical protein